MSRKEYVLIIIIGLLSSCSIDPPVSIQYCSDNIYGECQEYNDSIISSVSYIEYENNIFGKPVFNPNNSTEIVYLRKEENERELWYKNLVTGKNLFLAKNIRYAPAWGRGGWILFNKTNNQLYKIKPDGSNITQLTFDGINTYASWNPVGNKIVYVSNLEPYPYYLRIMDHNGNIEKVLTKIGGASQPSWSPDGKYIAYSSDSDIMLYNIETENSKNIYTDANAIFLNWVGNDKLLWWANDIFLTDLKNNSTEPLLNYCPSRSHSSPNVSGDFTKIIVSGNERIYIDNNYIDKKNISIIDIEEFSERKVICE